MILKNTYILTSSGWNLIQNLTPNQKICGLSNNNLSYSTITKIEKINYTGKIYTLNKSPLHPSTKLLTKNGRLQNISNIKNTKNIIIQHPYNYTGCRINPIKYGEHLFDTCLIMKIIGYFVECGFLKNKEVIFKNSELKLNHISETLKQLNIKNNIYTNNKGTLLYSNDIYIYNFLLQFYHHSGYKYIPEKFLTLDKCYLEWLLCSMFSSSAGENVLLKPGDNIMSYKFQYITDSKPLTDNLHEIAIKLGYYFNTTIIIYGNPTKRVQYDPLNYDVGTLATFVCKTFDKAITKSKLTTSAYHIYTKEKLKFITILNNSKPLFISF